MVCTGYKHVNGQESYSVSRNDLRTWDYLLKVDGLKNCQIFLVLLLIGRLSCLYLTEGLDNTKILIVRAVQNRFVSPFALIRPTVALYERHVHFQEEGKLTKDKERRRKLLFLRFGIFLSINDASSALTRPLQRKHFCKLSP